MTKKGSSLHTLPASKESEMMVLGCMLTSSSALSIGADGLEVADFYYTEHQIVFKALKAAFASDRPADVHLIGEALKSEELLPSIGGIAYLTELAQYAGTSAYIEEYVEVVRKKSILRQMGEAAKKIERIASQESVDVFSSLDEAQSLFFQISQSANKGVGVLLQDLLSGVRAESRLPYLKELQERQEKYHSRDPNDPMVIGLPSGFKDLDKLLNGFNPSNLIILAGRPSMGKTALAMNIAEHIAFDLNLAVGIFSLEMTAEEIVHRMICARSSVESEKIKMGSLDGIEYQKIVEIVRMMSERKLIIDDQPGMKITDLRARARRMKEVHDIKFIVIDYLQLLSGARGFYSSENRQNEISEISRMLKNLARELEIPVLCLSQLSRKVEERAGHRPMLSDLRESGCLAGDTLIQDAETGLRYTIKELAMRKEQTPLSVYALDDMLKIGKHSMTKVFYSGQKTVYELSTRSGRKIKASANHPFRTIGGWTALETLSVGQSIAIPRALPTSGTPPISDDELALLGHLLGDGCILPKQPYHYTSADEANIAIANQCANSLFGINPRIVRQKNWYHTYFPSPYKLTHGKAHPITNWFNQLGIERVRSYQKRVPEILFSCDEQKTALFLHHLWATDGNISLVEQKNKSPAAAIYYASSSELLSHQVQQLLLRVGVPSTIGAVPSKQGYRTMYHVRVQSAPHQIAFLSKIGSAGKRGEITPHLLALLKETKENPNLDIIPSEAWDLFVKPAKNKAALGWRDLAAKLGVSYSGSSMLKTGISRKRMSELSEVCSDKTLYYLAESDVYWDEIKSIQELGVEDVYDATVEGVHNFLANDIIVHNSIEQDADIVSFVFRREYYNANDKPGTAEVLVAKNRHGAIGDVLLAFRKKFGAFGNYTSSEPSHAQANDSAFAAFDPF